jgi:hypothetical protein
MKAKRSRYHLRHILRHRKEMFLHCSLINYDIPDEEYSNPLYLLKENTNLILFLYHYREFGNPDLFYFVGSITVTEFMLNLFSLVLPDINREDLHIIRSEIIKKNLIRRSKVRNKLWIYDYPKFHKSNTY